MTVYLHVCLLQLALVGNFHKQQPFLSSDGFHRQLVCFVKTHFSATRRCGHRQKNSNWISVLRYLLRCCCLSFSSYFSCLKALFVGHFLWLINMSLRKRCSCQRSCFTLAKCSNVSFLWCCFITQKLQNRP